MQVASRRGIRDATAIAVGMHHSCGLHADGAVSCWGYNLYGQLGDGTDASRARPVRVVGVADAVAIDAGETHACALRADGRLVCWGDARGYGLRDADHGPAAAVSRMLESPEPLVEVIAGSGYTCARASSEARVLRRVVLSACDSPRRRKQGWRGSP